MSRLFVVSGPSGAGKSSLCEALLKHASGLQLSISCTTRSPRPGEKNGCEYHFLTHALFREQEASGAFLEWANVHGHLYGTRESDVRKMLEHGNVLLEIDWQGARQVAQRIPDAKRIFILPPSIEVLRQRLQSRGQDDASVVEQRIAAADEEMAHASEAHVTITNADFAKSLACLRQIVDE